MKADQVQATIQLVYYDLQAEMSRSQAVHEEGVNSGRIPAHNIQVGSKVWLDPPNVQTTCPTQKLDWKRLGPFQVGR